MYVSFRKVNMERSIFLYLWTHFRFKRRVLSFNIYVVRNVIMKDGIPSGNSI